MCLAPKAQRSQQPGAAPQEAVYTKVPALKARFIPEPFRYVERQEEHHRTRTFQEEYRELLRRHGVEFDDRYVWD